MLHSESLQNLTESRVLLSILWEHFDEIDTGNCVGKAFICVMILALPLLEFGISLFQTSFPNGGP